MRRCSAPRTGTCDHFGSAVVAEAAVLGGPERGIPAERSPGAALRCGDGSRDRLSARRSEHRTRSRPHRASPSALPAVTEWLGGGRLVTVRGLPSAAAAVCWRFREQASGGSVVLATSADDQGEGAPRAEETRRPLIRTSAVSIRNCAINRRLLLHPPAAFRGTGRGPLIPCRPTAGVTATGHTP